MCAVECPIENERATCVIARRGGRTESHTADLLSLPQAVQPRHPATVGDPVHPTLSWTRALCRSRWEAAMQNRELPAIVVQRNSI